MSLVSDVIGVLSNASEPLTNKGIRERLGDGVDSTACGTALVTLMKKGAIERVEIDGQHHCGYVIAAGRGPSNTPEPDIAPTKKGVESAEAESEAAPVAAVAEFKPTHQGPLTRALMREAAALLLESAGSARMPERMRRCISDLLEMNA